MRAYEELLQHLEVSRPAGNGVIARCPAHEDRTPSMTVRPVEDRVLVHCFAGCAVDDILQVWGLDWSALFDNPPKARPLARPELIDTYTYVRPDGVPYLVVERWREASGKKTFKQRTPEGSYRVRGIQPVLYQLDRVVPHAQRGGEVWIVEGERDVHTAQRHGLVATTAPAGANQSWLPYFDSWLAGASAVNVVADNDPVGRKHAKAVRDSLRSHDLPVRVLRAKLGKDLSDHLDMHCLPLDELVVFDPDQRRGLGMSYDEIIQTDFPEPTWAVPDILPSGLTLLGGPPKMSKSWMALGVALGVGEGGRTMHELPCNQGDVLYLSLDNDSERRIQERIQYLYGGIAPRMLPIEFHTEWPTGVEAVAHCREWIQTARNPRLIVVDTMVRVEPGFDSADGGSLYSNSTTALGRWAKLANDNDVSILMVHHDRKTVSPDEDWLNRFTGSRGITATAAALWFLDAKRGAKDGMLRVTGRDIEVDDLPIRQLGPVWSVTEMPRARAAGHVDPYPPLRAVGGA